MSLVSTLLIAFNQEEFIAEALTSILNQDYEDQEIIISDDCSTDKTGEIILSYYEQLRSKFKRVKIIIQEQNLGLGGRNNIKFVSDQISEDSNFVQILDGDDQWVSNKTSQCVKFLTENSDFVAVHGGFAIKYFNGDETAEQRLGDGILENFTFPQLVQGNKVMTCTALWRTKQYKEAFNYELFTKHNIILGDYAGTLRISRMGQIGFILGILAKYRSHPNSTVNKPETRGEIVEDTIRLQELARQGII